MLWMKKLKKSKVKGKLLIFALLLVGFSACKSRKTPEAVDLSAQLTEQYWSNQFQFDYAELRGKATTTIGDKTHNLSLHIRMKKDSIVWGRMSLLGFDLAKFLITQDSFFMVSPMTSQYMAYSKNFLTAYTGFEPTVGQIQALIIGNAPFDSAAYTTEGNALLASIGNAANRLLVSKEIRTHTSLIETPDTNQYASFSYSTYAPLNNGLLPKDVAVDLKNGEQTILVSLNYQITNFNRIESFPFSIPSGFSRM